MQPQVVQLSHFRENQKKSLTIEYQPVRCSSHIIDCLYQSTYDRTLADKISKALFIKRLDMNMIKLKFAVMEETVANVRQEVNEVCHRDITPNYSVCKEGKHVAVITEKREENPVCVIMRKSVAVQTFETEEVVIPKQVPALNQSPNLAIVSSESGSAMKIDVSSQESAIGIACQGSLSVKESNSEARHYSDHRVFPLTNKPRFLLIRVPRALYLLLECRGLNNKMQDLRTFVDEKLPDPLLVQETKLKNNSNPYLPGYLFYRQDGPQSLPSGGTGIFIKNSLNHVELFIPNID
ncbi:hypothetical protein AVEN_23058-1 [Araneus ventricosus]|uniref:Uncharacterized protein n=1 Tax=Araneus ventricosus TaxID=182803 RepID=A0A4Y2IMT4_ARAVE|nr:hypothetical protein AVEN_23058-1 [Araneus ventricosus]